MPTGARVSWCPVLTRRWMRPRVEGASTMRRSATLVLVRMTRAFRRPPLLATLLLVAGLLLGALFNLWAEGRQQAKTPPDKIISENADRMMEEGRQTFRYDTFGSEAFWGDALKLHQAVAGAQNGGVGPGVSP